MCKNQYLLYHVLQYDKQAATIMGAEKAKSRVLQCQKYTQLKRKAFDSRFCSMRHSYMQWKLKTNLIKHSAFDWLELILIIYIPVMSTGPTHDWSPTVWIILYVHGKRSSEPWRTDTLNSQDRQRLPFSNVSATKQCYHNACKLHILLSTFWKVWFFPFVALKYIIHLCAVVHLVARHVICMHINKMIFF